MKRTDLIILITVSVLIGLGIYNYSSMSSWANFEEAFDNTGETYSVSGFLSQDHPVVYNPEVDPGLTSFYMEDKKGEVKKVYLQLAKPQGFEQSESIVLTGKAKDGVFHATDMQMKCPSKYNSEKSIVLGTEAS